VIMVLDECQAEADLASGAIGCAHCAGVLRPWSWAGARPVRCLDGRGADRTAAAGPLRLLHPDRGAVACLVCTAAGRAAWRVGWPVRARHELGLPWRVLAAAVGSMTRLTGFGGSWWRRSMLAYWLSRC
jgi:hypothetical protein